MDQDHYFSIFRLLPKQVIEYLRTKQVETQCIFTKQPDLQDDDQFVQAEQFYKLQIIQNYIVEVSPTSDKIIGGICLSLGIKFQLLMIESTFDFDLGRPFAIVLYISDGDDDEQPMAIKLGVEIEKWKDVDNFGKCLLTKEIMHLDQQKYFTIQRRSYSSYTACIYEATRKSNNQKVAIKSINKQIYYNLTKKSIHKAMQRQFLIPFRLNHSNICKMHQIYDSETNILLVMEKLNFNLLQFLYVRGFKSAQELWSIMKILFEAVNFIHARNIMHRDLKPENIMMRALSDDKYEPVIIDFGLAQYEGNKPYLFEKCGTPGYTAPQVISNNPQQNAYSKSCDMFSLGCIFYYCLFKKPLIYGSTLQETIKANKEFELNKEDQKYKIIHQAPRDLIFKLLERDPKNRLTAKQALQHQFFREQSQEEDQTSKDSGKEELFV